MIILFVIIWVVDDDLDSFTPRVVRLHFSSRVRSRVSHVVSGCRCRGGRYDGALRVYVSWCMFGLSLSHTLCILYVCVCVCACAWVRSTTECVPIHGAHSLSVTRPPPSSSVTRAYTQRRQSVLAGRHYRVLGECVIQHMQFMLIRQRMVDWWTDISMADWPRQYNGGNTSGVN